MASGAVTGRAALSRGSWGPSQFIHAVASLLTGVKSLHQRRLLVVSLFLVISTFGATRATDIDFWWHLQTGALIAQTGSIPVADPYSYTASGRPWIAHEWLWDLAIYHLYGIGGYRLAVLVSALIVALTYAILYRLLRQLGLNEFVAAALVIMAAALALPSIGVRPRELTHLFLAFYVSRLFLYREGRVRHLWSLPPVMALWVNVHGPFILGLGVLAIFLFGDLVRWLFAYGKAPRHLAIATGATIVASFANPQGPAMLLYPLGYYLHGDNPSFRNVSEFQSPNFHEPIPLIFAASILLFMLLRPPHGRLNLVDTLLLGAFTLQALISVRHITVYALVAVPLLGLRLRDQFQLARELPLPSYTLRNVALNWVILASLVGLGVWYANQPAMAGRLQVGQEPNLASLPVAGAQFIEDENLPGPVFNYQPWGGYLIYRWYPERLVFIDGRIDMYGSAISREYGEVALLQPGWRRVLEKYGVRTILIPKNSGLSTLLLVDGGWERVFQGEVEDVFVRRGQP